MPYPSKDHQFRPGTSGNPGGRPKGSSIRKRLREILDDDSAANQPLRDALIKAIVLNAIKNPDVRDLATLAQLEAEAEGAAGDQAEGAKRPRIEIPEFDDRLGPDDDDGGEDGEEASGEDG